MVFKVMLGLFWGTAQFYLRSPTYTRGIHVIKLLFAFLLWIHRFITVEVSQPRLYKIIFPPLHTTGRFLGSGLCQVTNVKRQCWHCAEKGQNASFKAAPVFSSILCEVCFQLWMQFSVVRVSSHPHRAIRQIKKMQYSQEKTLKCKQSINNLRF